MKKFEDQTKTLLAITIIENRTKNKEQRVKNQETRQESLKGE